MTCSAPARPTERARQRKAAAAIAAQSPALRRMAPPKTLRRRAHRVLSP